MSTQTLLRRKKKVFVNIFKGLKKKKGEAQTQS